MPTNYPGSLDDETTLPTATIVDGVTINHDIHHPSIHGATRALEAKFGIGSSTAAGATTGWVPVKQADGTTAWAAPPAGTPASTVTTLDYTTGSAVGSSGLYADGGHKHRLPGAYETFRWGFDAVTSPTTHPYVERVDAACTILWMQLVLGTIGGAGATLIVDMLKGGSSIISAGAPQIIVGQQISTNTPTWTSTALIADNLLVPKITQGSAGGFLLVKLRVQYTTPA